MDAVVDAVKKLAAVAESRVAPCGLTVARFETETPLIGTESLDDFAGLTKDAISLSKSLHEGGGRRLILLLTAITLFY